MSPIVREYYPVPRGDRQAYVHPPVGELPALVRRNRRHAAAWNFPFAGRPVREFRAAARAEIMDLARAYARPWGFAADRAWAEPQPIILTGHQPPPFHPGVWIKNFLAGRLARSVGGAALNLVVDNDEARGQVLRAPERSAGGVRAAEVELAAPAADPAFEEQPPSALRPQALHDLSAVLTPPSAEACRRFWAHLAAAVPQAASLAEALSAARRRLEEEVGLRNGELPVSQLADTQSFRLFAAEMLRRHEDLFAAHNAALAEYRRAYRERSAAQPVPDLARDGPRVEMPLWAWRAGEMRRHVWAEPCGGGDLAVYAGRERVGRVPAGDLEGAPTVAAHLEAWRRAGWKLRPRALTLTLFARLAVADTFIHGLGGALYEKITDGIFERLLGVRPPEIVLASCTVRLPLDTFPATERDLDAARRAVRDARYNPDRRLPEAVRARPDVRALIEEKGRLLADMPALLREDRRPAYLRIHQVNAILEAAGPDGLPAAQARLVEVERQLKYNAILRGREYPFFVYRAEDLAAFYAAAVPLPGWPAALATGSL
jgi:hypothetical protein